MSYKILRPFGPPIYKSTLSDSFMEFLKTVTEQTRAVAVNVGHNLAGNLESQFQAEMNNEQKLQFMAEIRQHVFSSLVEIDTDINEIFKGPPEIDRLNFNMGGGPWINFQKPNEFNPFHSHSGLLSCVIYIDVPEAIADENKFIKISTNAPSAGKISFIWGHDGYGTNSMFAHQPVTGEIFMFPAQLKHLVYPYKSNVERISMSFNVHNIETHTKIGV